MSMECKKITSKKILILGGSHRDIPLIEAAQEQGLYVITIGNGAGYIGHDYANECFRTDFNDIDTISSLIDSLEINYICPGCGEQSLLNTIILSEKHNIGSFDSLPTTMLLHNKANFKEFCLHNNISTPKGIELTNKNDIHNVKFDSFDYPLIVKPVNLSGGNGVTVVYTKEKLAIAIDTARLTSKRDDILIEEFIDGSLIAYSVFIKDEKPYICFSAKDDSFLNNYMVATSYPINLDIAVKEKLDDDIGKICEKLHLKDGPFHFQVLIKNNRPYIIDITRRIPGDLFPLLIEFCTGVKYSKSVIESAIGSNVTIEELTCKKHEYIIRHCIMPEHNGIYNDIFITEQLRNNVLHELYVKKKGEKINNYLKELIGILFLRFDSEFEMIDVLKNINTCIHPEIIVNGE